MNLIVRRIMNVFKQLFKRGDKLNANEVAVRINNKYERLDKYLENFKPVILFENASGSKETIILNDELSNYSRIDIEFFSPTIFTKYKTISQYAPNGKTIQLDMCMALQNAEFCRIESDVYKLNGNLLIYDQGTYVNIYGGIINARGTAKNFSISKVIGYK